MGRCRRVGLVVWECSPSWKRWLNVFTIEAIKHGNELKSSLPSSRRSSPPSGPLLLEIFHALKERPFLNHFPGFREMFLTPAIKRRNPLYSFYDIIPHPITYGRASSKSPIPKYLWERTESASLSIGNSFRKVRTWSKETLLKSRSDFRPPWIGIFQSRQG